MHRVVRRLFALANGTIWNALRVALRIISGIAILDFAFVALCGALQTHFHRWGRYGKRQLQRHFLRKRGAAGIPGHHFIKQKSHRFCISASTMASYWSGRRGSNSLPPPWQGGALPDELRPQIPLWRAGRSRRRRLLYRSFRLLSTTNLHFLKKGTFPSPYCVQSCGSVQVCHS